LLISAIERENFTATVLAFIPITVCAETQY